MKRLFSISCCVFLCGFLCGQDRAITQIAGDLYRFQNNAHYAVFLVTPEGIVVTDPINAEAAQWLKDQLAQRFSVPITHLIYSHHHADHITGGEVFGDQVTVIAHEFTKTALLAENAAVPIPDVTFEDRYTLELGGKKVELYYPGRSHSEDCIAMLFVDERTLFVVDFITVRRLPYRNLSGGSMPHWIDAIKRVEQLDFDILAPGHGVLGNKSHAVEHRQYLEALRDAVATAMERGKSLDQMKSSISLPSFSHFGNYQEWLSLNVEGMYQMLSEQP